MFAWSLSSIFFVFSHLNLYSLPFTGEQPPSSMAYRICDRVNKHSPRSRRQTTVNKAIREEGIYICNVHVYVMKTASSELNNNPGLPCLFTAVITAWKQIICVMRNLAVEVEFCCCPPIKWSRLLQICSVLVLLKGSFNTSFHASHK